MTGAKGSALEWALALLHAPGERHGLRQRPLPPGIDVLLGIAAGAMPDALAAAATSFGEPEAKIREAAQFYVREVMFFPQADAYRMLGVARDAEQKQIKTHHRLLQRWLHPDRPQSQDDAVFAARVNSAWNSLRSPDRRRAYDEALQQARSVGMVDGSDAPRTVGVWMPTPELAALQSPWRRRAPVLVLLIACGVLALLAVRDMNREVEAWDGSRDTAVATETLEAPGISVPKPVVSVSARASNKPARTAIPSLQQTSATAAKVTRQPAMLAAATPSHTVALATPSAPARTQAAAVNVPAPAVKSKAAPGLAVAEPVTAAVVHEVSPEADAPPLFPRIQAARKTGDLLLRFMQSPTRAIPPIWNSPGIQSSAELLRQDLHSAGRVRLSGPQWQIGNDSAQLTSEYTRSGVPDGSGTLKANLRWRDGYWLVTGLSLEYAR